MFVFTSIHITWNYETKFTTKFKLKQCIVYFRNVDYYRSIQLERNWVFATNSDFLITISLEPNVVDSRYFKLWILLDQIFRAWNIKGSKDIRVWIFEIVTKTQFLWIYYLPLRNKALLLENKLFGNVSKIFLDISQDCSNCQTRIFWMF